MKDDWMFLVQRGNNPGTLSVWNQPEISEVIDELRHRMLVEGVGKDGFTIYQVKVEKQVKLSLNVDEEWDE